MFIDIYIYIKMDAFKFKHDAKYRAGGVYNPTHRFSLITQIIQVNKKHNVEVRLPNIWRKYKLPPVEHSQDYNNWVLTPMQFWQNQLNFAVWCATTGCGVSKEDHLQHKDPMIRSLYRFHAYYQIRRILHDLECPTPNNDEWNPLNNNINMGAYTN